MTKLLTRHIFMAIFKNENYRKKLDQIILNFFGLDSSLAIKRNEIKETDITIEIIVMLNTEITFTILVKDTQSFLQASKKFYLNLSYREVEKYYDLLIPCYWEVYIPYAYHHIKNTPKIILLASLFFCESSRKFKSILKKLEIFNQREIEEILKIIKK